MVWQVKINSTKPPGGVIPLSVCQHFLVPHRAVSPQRAVGGRAGGWVSPAVGLPGARAGSVGQRGGSQQPSRPVPSFPFKAISGAGSWLQPGPGTLPAAPGPEAGARAGGW